MTTDTAKSKSLTETVIEMIGPELYDRPKFPLAEFTQFKSHAETVWGLLVQQIIDFEASLDVKEVIGGKFTSSPAGGAMYIKDLQYRDPDIIVMVGKDSSCRPMQLVQHYSQVSVLLTALPLQPNEERPHRIGFDLGSKLNEHIKEAAKGDR